MQSKGLEVIEFPQFNQTESHPPKALLRNKKLSQSDLPLVHAIHAEVCILLLLLSTCEFHADQSTGCDCLDDKFILL